jgi:hypothetical protein
MVDIILQTDQKLRVCDICGAFLSIYDRCVPMVVLLPSFSSYSVYLGLKDGHCGKALGDWLMA